MFNKAMRCMPMLHNGSTSWQKQYTNGTRHEYAQYIYNFPLHIEKTQNNHLSYPNVLR